MTLKLVFGPGGSRCNSAQCVHANRLTHNDRGPGKQTLKRAEFHLACIDQASAKRTLADYEPVLPKHLVQLVFHPGEFTSRIKMHARSITSRLNGEEACAREDFGCYMPGRCRVSGRPTLIPASAQRPHALNCPHRDIGREGRVRHGTHSADRNNYGIVVGTFAEPEPLSIVGISRRKPFEAFDRRDEFAN